MYDRSKARLKNIIIIRRSVNGKAFLFYLELVIQRIGKQPLESEIFILNEISI